MRALLILAALALGGCTFQVPINLPGSLQSQPAPDIAVTVPIPGPAPAPLPLVVCPPLVTYTAVENDARDKALDALPPDSELRRVLADYHNMRVADDLCLHPK